MCHALMAHQTELCVVEWALQTSMEACISCHIMNYNAFTESSISTEISFHDCCINIIIVFRTLKSKILDYDGEKSPPTLKN